VNTAAGCEEETTEAGFQRTVRYRDLSMQLKTDLFLQHYVPEPVGLLIRQIKYLAVIVTLPAAGTIVVLMGMILFIATLVPLRAALFVTGALIFGTGGIIAYLQLSDKIILKTPVATEMIRDGTA
jgi:hypothetical protein